MGETDVQQSQRSEDGRNCASSCSPSCKLRDPQLRLSSSLLPETGTAEDIKAQVFKVGAERHLRSKPQVKTGPADLICFDLPAAQSADESRCCETKIQLGRQR